MQVATQMVQVLADQRVITKGDGQPVHRLRDLFEAHARMNQEKLNIGLVSRVVANQPAGNEVRRRKREQGQAAAQESEV